MKLKLLRLFLPLFIIVFALPMIIPGPDGEPVMSLDDWLPSADPIKKSVEQLTPQSTKTMYKWQDENGQWHFSDKAGDVPEQVIEQNVPEVVNSMEALSSSEKNSEKTSVELKVPDGFQFSPTTVPLQDIPELIDEAKKARAMLEDRQKQLEEL